MAIIRLSHRERKDYLRVSLFCLLVALVCIVIHILYGCSGLVPVKQGFHKTTQITVKVHLVGDRALFSHPPARNWRAGAPIWGGYASNTDPPEIWLLGHYDKGYYPDDPTILGHEFWEALRFVDPQWRSPH